MTRSFLSRRTEARLVARPPGFCRAARMRWYACPSQAFEDPAGGRLGPGLDRLGLHLRGGWLDSAPARAWPFCPAGIVSKLLSTSLRTGRGRARLEGVAGAQSHRRRLSSPCRALPTPSRHRSELAIADTSGFSQRDRRADPPRGGDEVRRRAGGARSLKLSTPRHGTGRRKSSSKRANF